MLRKLLLSSLFLFGTICFSQSFTLVASTSTTGGQGGSNNINASVNADQEYIVVCSQPPTGGPYGNRSTIISSSPLSQHWTFDNDWLYQYQTGNGGYQPYMTIGYDTFANSGAVTFTCNRANGPGNSYMYVLTCPSCNTAVSSFFGNASGSSAVTTLSATGITTTAQNNTILCGANSNTQTSSTIATINATQVIGTPCWAISNAGIYSSQSATLNLNTASEIAMAGIALGYTPSPPPTLTVTLAGSIAYHNNVPFNGSLMISLGKASVLDTCADPMYVVRSAQVSIPVVNGSISSSDTFIPSSCLGGLPYYVQFFDSKNNNVANVNWYIVPDSTGTLNVGDMVVSNFGGPIVVAVPLPIISNPSGNQTVTQPTGTALSVNNLTVTNQLTYTGTIGGSVSGNAATATQLQNATTQCASGYYATGITQAGNANCSNSFPASASTFNYVTVNGGSGTYTSAAGYFNYNMNNNGRLDFIDNPGVNTGGWDWYKSSDTSTPVAHMDINGNMTATSFIGALTGNASSATSLASTPAQCPSGQLATGIQANGNANCSGSSAGSRVCNSNGCYIVRTDGTIIEWGQYTNDLNGGTAFISFPYTFPSSCSTVLLTTSGSTDRISYLATGGYSSPACSTSGFTAGNNGSNAGVTWFAIGW